ncbi:MAG: hypothetical protein MPK31_01570 [Gammaproteobacteria bacterium]|nr:hypothetical protein [Gammaproteobacteria bacterium]
MLTQTEADMLIAMRKIFADRRPVSIQPGAPYARELYGDDKHEKFLLDIWMGKLRLSKIKHQARARKCVVLVRLDINSAPHTNPDGKKIGGTHIHVYREEYDDKWAYPVPPEFRNTADQRVTFKDFCAYCKIDNPPPFSVRQVQQTLL